MKSISSHPTRRHTLPRKGMSRAAVVVLAALTPIMGLLVVAQPAASSANNAKVFVCKYVGTPGVNEQLKAGKQPIYVSSSATVGTWFKDKQGRSFVLAVSTTANTDKHGKVYTGTLTCPAPVGPTKVTPVAPTTTAPTCLADGTLVVPADTAAIDYTSTPSGTGPGTYTVTATAKTGYVVDGQSSWTLTVAPMLTGEQCSTTVLAVPVAPTVTMSTDCESQGSYVIPTTDGVTYLLGGKTVAAGKHQGPASGTVTAKAAEGYTLSNAAWSYKLVLPAAEICEVDAPTTTTPTETTTGLPKTGAPVATLATAGALALLLGFALLAAGTRRSGETLS